MTFPRPLRRSPLLLAGLLAGVFVHAAAAGAATSTPPNVHAGSAYVPNEVIVRYKPTATKRVRAAAQRATGAGDPEIFAPYTRVLKIKDGESVAATIAELKRRPGVLDAYPNVIAHASYVPNDKGNSGVLGGWQALQWNFSPESGVNAPAAWDRLNAVGRPGGAGVKVAVLDTGVAYARHRGFRRSPDLLNHFLRGFDFVDDDAYPDDLNGHGTHVASTIAETTGNGIGVTGLAYGVRLMPVRVLDRAGTGDSVAISAGLRYAARKGAKVINLSFEFDSSVTRGQIPDILDALRYARRKGALVIGASGNFSAHAVAYPARASERDVRGRHDRARVPGGLLQLRQRPRHLRPRRRPRRRHPRRPELPPGRRAGRPRHLPDDLLDAVGPPLRAAERLRRHVDGRAARVRDRRAGDRLRRHRPEPDARARSRRG